MRPSRNGGGGPWLVRMLEAGCAGVASVVGDAGRLGACVAGAGLLGAVAVGTSVCDDSGVLVAGGGGPRSDEVVAGAPDVTVGLGAAATALVAIAMDVGEDVEVYEIEADDVADDKKGVEV